MLNTEDTEHTKDKVCLFGYGLNISGKDNIGYPVQEIYFISYDEIKEGDLCISGNQIFKSKTDEHAGVFQKIIASTDKLLNLPLIPEGFVKNFCQTYNEKSIDILEVELETMIDCTDNNCKGTCGECKCMLEVPKTNEDGSVMIIDSTKIYSRDELIEKIWDYKNAVNKDEFINTDKWIEDNL